MIATRTSTPNLDLLKVNQQLQDTDASAIVKWSQETFGDGLVMTTSFGIQAAVMLHLVTSIIPDIPVIWIDTGYLPTETYIFADRLTKKTPAQFKGISIFSFPARMEALHGKLWETNSVEALNLYDHIRKVEPMQRALKELNATAWLAGLRKGQTKHRQTLNRVELQGNIHKIYPILNWHSRDIYQYLTAHDLPYHPYFDLGYVSVGDWHSSRPLTADDDNERDTRFSGLKQECGLHLPQTDGEAESLNSSSL